MGVTLHDLASDEAVFDVNFWHWRALAEAVRRLDVLPAETVDLLHEPFVGELTEPEARLVAEAIQTRLLPTLPSDERVMLDGTRTTTPDDGTFYREPARQHLNYSTDRATLEEFATCCARCAGFRVG